MIIYYQYIFPLVKINMFTWRVNENIAASCVWQHSCGVGGLPAAPVCLPKAITTWQEGSGSRGTHLCARDMNNTGKVII